VTCDKHTENPTKVPPEKAIMFNKGSQRNFHKTTSLSDSRGRDAPVNLTVIVSVITVVFGLSKQSCTFGGIFSPEKYRENLTATEVKMFMNSIWI